MKLKMTKVMRGEALKVVDSLEVSPGQVSLYYPASRVLLLAILMDAITSVEHYCKRKTNL